MIRIVQAELQRLLRRRTIVATAAASLAFAVVATLAVFASATDGPSRDPRGGVTIADLAGAGGGTEAFAVGASFVGFLVFVLFIGLVATEFSGGTLRALLLRDPHRLRMITGKLVGALLVAAAAIAVAEAASFGLSMALAPSKDIGTGVWFSLDGVGHALADYGTVLAGVTGWAIFGTTLGVIFRSVPLALGVGFAWAGPFENIVVDSWTTGYRVFPGQVLAAIIQGGTPEISLTRAAVTGIAYVGIAAAATATLLTGRDVTS
jgi:ABC-type transport system involved in multi-copper enzyme maturation permease subunit